MSGWNITENTVNSAVPFLVFQELSSIVQDLKRVEQQLLGMDLILLEFCSGVFEVYFFLFFFTLL